MAARTFFIGDHWVYYKIYGGEKTTDRLLIEVLKPFIDTRTEVSQWFFIRYADPEPHLRLRLFVKDLEHLGNLLVQCNALLKPYLENDSLHNICIDTYQRELERYGTQTIALAESLFALDTLYTLDVCAVQSDETTRLYAAILGMDQLLRDFDLDLNARAAFAARNQAAFRKEFHTFKTTHRQLDAKFKQHQATLIQVLQGTSEAYAFLNALHNQKSARQKPWADAVRSLLKENQPPIAQADWMSSMIHLNLNRMFHTRQRQYEMLCYDFLSKVYQRMQYSANNPASPTVSMT
jgi:thiopeptide-type bacteriocin biosynthesis protein